MATSNSVIKIGSQFDALIGLTELTGFNQYAKEHTAPQVVSIIQKMALITERVIAPSRGCIVKYLGDAALSVFPDHAVDEGVRLILIVRQKLAEVMKEIDCPCRLCIRAHFGPVIGVNLPPVVGPDVIGHTINVTARLNKTAQNSQVIITEELYQKIKPTTQRQFHLYDHANVYVIG